MAEAVLGALGDGDGFGDVGGADDRQHRHEELVLHEGVLLGDFADREAAVVAGADADLLQDEVGVLADPFLVGVVTVEDHLLQL